MCQGSYHEGWRVGRESWRTREVGSSVCRRVVKMTQCWLSLRSAHICSGSKDAPSKDLGLHHQGTEERIAFSCFVFVCFVFWGGGVCQGVKKQTNKQMIAGVQQGCSLGTVIFILFPPLIKCRIHTSWVCMRKKHVGSKIGLYSQY